MDRLGVNNYYYEFDLRKMSEKREGLINPINKRFIVIYFHVTLSN